MTNNLTGYHTHADGLAANIDQPDLVLLIQKFLRTQDSFHASEKITVYPSAVASFYSPSDISGEGGMRYERIRAVDSWRKGPARYDCILVETNLDAPGMRGLDVARVRVFFSFDHNNIEYPCALVRWFSCVAEPAETNTGMWVVEPEFADDGRHHTSVIHLDTIVRAAHLLPVFGEGFVTKNLSFTDTLDKFPKFYVNKYADHHAFEIAF